MTITIIAAIGLTGASMIYSDEFCMCGQGRGLPFAAVHPSHDEDELVIPLYDRSKTKWGQELDLPRTGGNIDEAKAEPRGSSEKPQAL